MNFLNEDKLYQISKNFTLYEQELSQIKGSPYQQIFHNIQFSQLNFHIAQSNNVLAILYKEQSQLSDNHGNEKIKNTIYVFSLDGLLLGQFQIKQPDQVLTISFTQSTGQIIILFNDGEIQFFSTTGILIYRTRLISDYQNQKLIQSFSIRNDGVCVIYNDNSICYIQSFFQFIDYGTLRVKSIKPQILSNKVSNIIQLQFIPSQFNQTQILVLYEEENQEKLLLINCQDPTKNKQFLISKILEQQQLKNISIYHSYLHSNSQLFILASLECIVLLDLTQFLEQQIIPEVKFVHEISQIDDFPISFIDILPVYFNRISNQVTAIVLSKQQTKEVVISLNQAVSFLQFEEGLILISDCFSSFLIYQVDQSLLGVSKAGLVGTDQQKLLQAYSVYTTEKKNYLQESEQLLGGIVDLKATVKDLILLSQKCLDCKFAGQIMKAVSYAKLFLPQQFQQQTTEMFDYAKTILQVRISLKRISSVQIVISKELIRDIVYQLVSSTNGDLALKLVKIFNLDNEDIKQVLIYKTFLKVLDQKNNGITDQEMFNQIEHELQGFDSSGVFRQCAELLTKNSQRNGLVTFLIEKEPSLVDQVKLYYELHEYDKAIQKAYQAHNEDLVIDSLIRAFNDQTVDTKKLFMTLFQKQNSTDQLPFYIKNLIQTQIFQSLKLQQQLPQLQKNSNSILDKYETLEYIQSLIEDPSFQYQNLLIKTNQNNNTYQLKDKFFQVQDLNQCCDEKSDNKLAIDSFFNGLQLVQSHKSFLKVVKTQKNLSIIFTAIGKEIIEQGVNKTGININDSSLLKDVKHYINKFGKCQIDEEFILTSLSLGMMENEQYTKGFIDFALLQSNKQSKLFIPNVLLNCKISSTYLMQDQILRHLGAFIDKKDLFLFSLKIQSTSMLSKSMESCGQYEITLIHWIWKTLTNEIQATAKDALK